MGALIILAFGVCCALLCHWIVRHTYEDWDWEEFDKPTEEGIRRKKVWNVKLTLPRYVYILLWVICTVFAPIAVVCPLILAYTVRRQHQDYDWHFECENKLWKWTISIRDWFTKEV